MKKQLEDRVFMYSRWLRKRYGTKVFRVGLSTGITCPHRIETGGCIYCNPRTFTGEYQDAGLSIARQMARAIPRIKASCGDVKLLAYFQDETSTAGPISYLRKCFLDALVNPDVVGLVVSTRPDAVRSDVLEMLKSLKIPVTIELGLQSIHDKSLTYLNRGHSFAQVQDAVARCGKAGMEVGVHLIIGIPGETETMMRETVEWVGNNPWITQVKFHNLVIYKDTKLARMAEAGEVMAFGIQDYVPLLARLLTYLPGTMPVLRLFTSNVRREQIALGEYPGNKTKWMSLLRNEMNEKNVVQGQQTAVPFTKEDTC